MIRNRIYIINYLRSQKTRRILLRASGKPSTWFPLGEHVQKAEINVLLIFQISRNVHLLPLKLSCSEKNLPIRYFHFSWHLNFSVALVEALIYQGAIFW